MPPDAGEAMMLDQMANGQKARQVPGWAVALFIAGELAIIVIAVAVFHGGYTPLANMNQELIPWIFPLLILGLIILGIYLTYKKRSRLFREIPARLETLGVNFSSKKAGLIPKFEGTYNDQKIAVSLNIGRSDVPESYVITLFHRRLLNVGLLCTNTRRFIGSRQVNLPYFKPLGSSRINIGGNPKNLIHSWAKDSQSAVRILAEAATNASLEKLAAKIQSCRGSFVINDRFVRIALPVSCEIDSELLMAAYSTSNEFAGSSFVPQVAPGKSPAEVLIKGLAMALVMAFMIVIILTILNG